MNSPFAISAGGLRGWCAFALASLLVACSPSPDQTSEVDPNEVDPERGRVIDNGRCRLTIGDGNLNSTVTFSLKGYNDPFDMALDTAPAIPAAFEHHFVSYGCYYAPTAVPLREGGRVAVDPRSQPNHPLTPSKQREAFDRLFAEGRDSASLMLVLYRAEPFGAWRAELIVYHGGMYSSLRRGNQLIHYWCGDCLHFQRLGYFFVAAGLYFSPNLPESITIDEGAPIPYALGLAGTLAASSGIELFWTAGAFGDESGYRAFPPGQPLVGEIPFQDSWRDRTELEITLGGRYVGPVAWANNVVQTPFILSRTMTVTVVSSPPRIDSAPASVTVAEGQTAAFTVAASGSRPLAYQWQRNGVDLPGATGTTYTTPPTTAADDGAQFRVVVTNARGTTTTAAATLTVLPASAAPEITRGPLPITVVAGQPASFDVVATGAAPLAYQWLRDGNPIAGATASSYTLPTATLADDGALFAVRVSNAVNAAGVTSAAARLTVTSPGGLARGAGEIVSVRPDGTLGAADSSFGDMIAVSRDGRYVAFTSSAPLAGGTACGLFLRDMQARTTQLLSLRPDGTPSEPGTGGTCLDGRLAMTPDARHIVFVSSRTDLVDRSFGPGVRERVYVRDTCIGATGACTPRTTLVSVDDNDAELTTGSDYPSISDNGRYVAFRGRAPNQVAFTNAAVIHDRDADGNGVYDERPATPNPASPTFRSFAVSRRSDGTLFQGAFTPMISGNGRFVVFTGQINSAGDCTGPGQSTSICVYVYDRDADGNGVLDETTVSGGVRTVLVSVNSAGQPAQGGALTDPWISADGRVVTFRGPATNLGAATPSTNRTYAHDRDVAGTGFFDTPGNIATVVAGRDAQGNEADVDYALNPGRGSRLGRFMLLAANANLAPPIDPSGSGFRHLFLRDLCIGAAAPAGCTPSTVRISVRSTGALPATSLSTVAWFGALSADGQRVAFSQSGGGLVDLNGDGQPDEHTSREVYFGGTGTGEPM